MNAPLHGLLPYWLGKDELFTYDITLEFLVLNISSEVVGNKQ